MKRLFLVAVLLCQTGWLSSAPPVYEQVITSVGTATTVSVSTSAWTRLPATSSLSGRTGVMITNDSANASNCAIIISSSATEPTEATTVRPGSLRPGVTAIIGAGNNMYIYALYLGASAGNVHVQELRQN